MLEEITQAPVRIGLNSLRDFYLDKWRGKTANGVEDADRQIAFLVDTLNEAAIIKKLKAGETYVLFVKDFKIGEQIKTDYASLKEISFRIIPVEMDLGLVYFYVNRDKGHIKTTFISAELEGMNKLLREKEFSREHSRAMMECRIPDRIICIPEVNMILSDPNLVEAFVNYSPHFNRKDYENWRDEYRITLKIRKGHRYLISRVVKSITFLLKRNNGKKREG